MVMEAIGNLASNDLPEELKRDTSEIILATEKAKKKIRTHLQKNRRRKRRSAQQEEQDVEAKSPVEVCIETRKNKECSNKCPAL